MSQRMACPPRVGSAAQHLMMAAHALLPKLGNWMTSKRDQNIVVAQGGGAEALKDRAQEMGGMKVQLKLMAAAVAVAAAAAPLRGMIGALWMMITRTTVAHQEAVSHHRSAAQ